MSENTSTTTTATTTPPTPAPTPTTPHTVCELQVDTQSPGWQKTLCKVLKGIQGVSFTIDASRGRARVSGEVFSKFMVGKSGLRTKFYLASPSSPAVADIIFSYSCDHQIGLAPAQATVSPNSYILMNPVNFQ
ncbi:HYDROXYPROLINE-RICH GLYCOPROTEIN FAMILY PROTEIN [Salix viminalis]|uniref:HYDROXYPROLINE-RICH GLYCOPROTEIN FAMILY PROTEIN n=1 Tax=Salix viminalis TaxID=40686 RepID=A0A9Q0UVP3_SALVM|nr:HYDROXYPROLINE-RICH GLYCOPROTEIN FAMILY PROTEIN [Salix viminalis]